MVLTCLDPSPSATLPEDRKLKTFKGVKGTCLTQFVEKYPEKKAYFEISNETMKFVFPEPGPLEGVKSRSKVGGCWSKCEVPSFLFWHMKSKNYACLGKTRREVKKDFLWVYMFLPTHFSRHKASKIFLISANTRILVSHTTMEDLFLSSSVEHKPIHSIPKLPSNAASKWPVSHSLPYPVGHLPSSQLPG